MKAAPAEDVKMPVSVARHARRQTRRNVAKALI
jgi:hypothetical protein